MSTAMIIQQSFKTRQQVRLGAMTGAQFKKVMAELKKLHH